MLHLPEGLFLKLSNGRNIGPISNIQAAPGDTTHSKWVVTSNIGKHAVTIEPEMAKKIVPAFYRIKNNPPTAPQQNPLQHGGNMEALAKILRWDSAKPPPLPPGIRIEMWDDRHWDGMMKRLQNNERMPYTQVYNIGNYIKDWGARPNYVKERALRQLGKTFSDDGGVSSPEEHDQMMSTSRQVDADIEKIKAIHQQLMSNGYNFAAVRL